MSGNILRVFTRIGCWVEASIVYKKMAAVGLFSVSKYSSRNLIMISRKKNWQRIIWDTQIVKYRVELSKIRENNNKGTIAEFRKLYY